MNHLESINTFIQVVERQSFTAAADYLNIAKSIVSKRIKDLESHLGVQLIHRTTRRIHLTQSGEYYYQRCQNILQELAETHQILAEQNTQLSGKIKIAAPLSFSLLHLQTVFNQFLQQNANIQLEIDYNDCEVNMIEEGFDLGIRIGELQDSTLIAKKLTTIKFVTLASPNYLDKKGQPKNLSELKHHDWLVYNNYPSGILWPYQQHHLKDKIKVIANSGDSLLKLAVEGLGIIITPTFMAYDEISKGKLIPILSDIPHQSLNAYIIYPSRRYQPQKIRSFVEYLLRQFEGSPYWDKEH